MKVVNKYLIDSVIDIKRKLKHKEKEEDIKLTDVSTIARNMIKALTFVMEEVKKGRNIKKVKSMLDRIIKELQILRNEL